MRLCVWDGLRTEAWVRSLARRTAPSCQRASGGVAAAHGDQVGRTERARRRTCLQCSAIRAGPRGQQLHRARAVAVGLIQSKSHHSLACDCGRCSPQAIFAAGGYFYNSLRVPHHAARHYARRFRPHAEGRGTGPQRWALVVWNERPNGRATDRHAAGARPPPESAWVAATTTFPQLVLALP